MVVYTYDKNLPKSGKSIIEFCAHKLCHRSLVSDKSDMLVHVDSRVVLRSYPTKTDRSIVLDDMANNIERLEQFLGNQELYNIQSRPKIQKIEDDGLKQGYECKMDFYSDGSCVTPRNNKKSYNIKDCEW